MWNTYINNVKNIKPIIHNITNYVTVNDCANILLACGASPIMADEKEEVEQITTICHGLNINIGTLQINTIESMLLAGKKANELQHPIVLDPVGIGASTLRTKTAIQLVNEIDIQVIRGNISEIKALALGTKTVQGVDAAISDTITKENLKPSVAFIKKFAKEKQSIIVVTGAIDIITDGKQAYVVNNGNAMMSAVTGTGCMLSAVIAAYIAANPTQMLEATLSAVVAMGISGELAYERLSPLDGNSSYRNYIIDAMYHMHTETLQKRAKYEIY